LRRQNGSISEPATAIAITKLETANVRRTILRRIRLPMPDAVLPVGGVNRIGSNADRIAGSLRSQPPLS
jgi:hypothetical protein